MNVYNKSVLVRVNSDDWQQFANVCKLHNTSCSEVLRRFIADVISNGQFYGGHEILKLNLMEAIEYGRKTTSDR